MNVVRVVCGWIMDGHGRVLLVRKDRTDMFMFPGGKPEPGEAPRATLSREIAEELGCAIAPPADGRDWPGGTLRAVAANEAGYLVEARLLPIALAGVPGPCAEIAELAWIDRQGRDTQGRSCPCAPLTAIAWSAYDGFMASRKSCASRA